MKPPFKTIIVDDSRAQIEALQSKLAPFKEVLEITATADSYRIAMKEFEKNSFDVAIVDYKLDTPYECWDILNSVSKEKRKITVFKTTQDDRTLNKLSEHGEILFISPFFSDAAIADFIDKLLLHYNKHFPFEDIPNFYLKSQTEKIVTPVSFVYLLETYERESTKFHIFNGGDYRTENQNGRLQNHIIKMQNSCLYVPKRGFCVNMNNVLGIRTDSTLIFKNHEILRDKNFPTVPIPPQKIRAFEQMLVKFNKKFS